MSRRAREATRLRTDIARRLFLQGATGLGLGNVALGMLQEENDQGSAGRSDLPHHTPRARNVIFLTQSGGPSQI